MAKKYNWKKWPPIIVIVFGLINVWQHSYYQKSIAETFSEGLDRIDYRSPKINGVRLPLSFTLFAQRVESEIVFEDGDLLGEVTVTLTPLGILPFVWFLFDSAYHLDMNQQEMDKLSRFKKGK